MQATAVSLRKFADCGPGDWWYVALGNGRLLEIGDEQTARQLAKEINAGRAALKGAPVMPSDAEIDALIEQARLYAQNDKRRPARMLREAAAFLAALRDERATLAEIGQRE